MLILLVCTYIGSNKPTIKLLIKYKEFAPRWYSLGLQLLEQKYIDDLDIIQANYPADTERCCTEMFKHWLNVDTEASWDKLMNTLEKTGQNTLAQKIKQDVLTVSIIHICSYNRTW